MIKIIGILILSSSISVYGTLCSSALKEAIRLRYEIIQLLNSIQNGIRYGSVPIDRIINDRKFPLIEKSNFYDLYNSGGNMQDIIGECFKSLSKEDKDMLLSFFTTIGKTAYSEKEINLCFYYVDYFEKTQAEREKDTASKVLLYKKIGIVSGILCAIIFI